jgi:DNA-binding CsgD family transcriptional regulator
MKQRSMPAHSDSGSHRDTAQHRDFGNGASRVFHEALRRHDQAGQPAALSRLFFWRQAKTSRGQKTLRIVWAVLFGQFLFSIFIIGHEMLELQGIGSMNSNRIVVICAVLLAVFVLVSLYAVNILLREIRSADTARAVAKGALAQLLDVHFAEWKLTSAERDVALFALKGFETSEIAGFRNASQGTIRVQLAQIYGKAGVHSRGAFQSLFLEDLLDLSENHAAEVAAAGA